jgi:hypothetical protein
VRPLGGSDRACLDEDFIGLAQVHPSGRLAIAERDWKTSESREPPELVDWPAQGQ